MLTADPGAPAQPPAPEAAPANPPDLAVVAALAAKNLVLILAALGVMSAADADRATQIVAATVLFVSTVGAEAAVLWKSLAERWKARAADADRTQALRLNFLSRQALTAPARPVPDSDWAFVAVAPADLANAVAITNGWLVRPGVLLPPPGP